jgi:K+-sensing histidine kinase KdpD
MGSVVDGWRQWVGAPLRRAVNQLRDPPPGESRNLPLTGAVIGLVLALLIDLPFLIFEPHITRAIPELLLLIPVTVASVIGGWKASLPVALTTGAAYSLHFIAPVGVIQIGLTDDTLSILTFVVVAMTISEIGRRRDARRLERERQRSVLLRTVSHDLRNPLGTIRAASADLRSDVVNDPIARNVLLDLVVEEADRLDRIIRNLLSLARVEAGALAPDQADESIAEIAKASASRLQRSAVAENAPEIVIDIPDDLPAVYVDRVQIDQVLTNLIENAVRHAVGSSTILVTARRSLPSEAPDCVTVSVTDGGPGFSATARTQAFTFFKPSGVTGAEGIGLAVCKAIVEAHGGTISMDDQLDRGARVTFSIPTAR